LKWRRRESRVNEWISSRQPAIDHCRKRERTGDLDRASNIINRKALSIAWCRDSRRISAEKLAHIGTSLASSTELERLAGGIGFTSSFAGFEAFDI
jgi:hypothetical protein